MLVELHGQDGTPVCVHVDHMTALAIRRQVRFYGPYCNRACWQLDAQPGDASFTIRH
jgi:hypothetical protein